MTSVFYNECLCLSLDFGSTASLASSISGSYPNIPKDKPSGNVRASRLDPALYRKHRERNISLRLNLSERLLKPVIATSIKKMDKLSQNISNYQLSVSFAILVSSVRPMQILKVFTCCLGTDAGRSLPVSCVYEQPTQVAETTREIL